MNSNLGKIWCSALVAATFAIAGGAVAAVPTVGSVEGVLTSGGGGPAADGQYQVTFAIYSAPTGGNAVWTEGPVAVTVKNGQFGWQIGSKTPLSPAGLNMAVAYLGIQIANDPELPRQPIGADLFSQRAAIAEGLDCSGCLKGAMLDAGVLQPYAKSSDLGVFAKSADLGPYAKTADLAGFAKSTDLADYVKAAALAKVAATGDWADLKNTPKLADVAKTGAYGDLTNQPVLAKIGTACGTGLVLNGFKADGGLDCGPLKVPPDYIDEISNGLIWNQFVDSVAGSVDVGIPDGKGAGTSDSLVFPDIGSAQAVWVDFDVSNSDVSKMKVELFGPNMSNPYILYDGTKVGAAFKVSFNKDTPLSVGDMNKDWVGKNIAGTWSITVKDPLDNVATPNDGKFNWAISIQTLSTKKIQIKGNAIVDGSVKIGTDAAACDATKKNALRYDKDYGLEACNGTDWVTALPKPVNWSGGCPNHSVGGGEDTYCLSGVDYNNMGKYLDINGNGTVTVLIDGYYRINCYMDGTTTSYRRMIFRRTPKGGSEADFAYAHLYETGAGWHFISLDTTWPMKKGDTFRIVGQNDTGNYRWHSWNTLGQHSRAQFSYEGPLAQ